MSTNKEPQFFFLGVRNSVRTATCVGAGECCRMLRKAWWDASAARSASGQGAATCVQQSTEKRRRSPFPAQFCTENVLLDAVCTVIR